MRHLRDSLLDSALLFSFLAGALISLAGNFFTSALLWTTGLPLSRATLNWLGLCAALASFGSFRAGITLDGARRAWETQGSASTTRADHFRRFGSRGFGWGLGLMVFGLAIALAIYMYAESGAPHHGA